ncbi:MAG: G1 family glutamic endopeptidase [Terriglobales bacterium]
MGIDGIFASDGVEGANPAFEPGLAGGVWEATGFYNGNNNPCTPSFAFAVFGYFWPGYSGLKYATFNPNIGDVFFADVFATGPNTGYVYLSDLTTFTAAEYSVSTPGLIGQNVAWMVSRSCCDNPNLYGTFPLANTASVFFGGGNAETGNGKFFYPGSQATSTLILSMTDDKGDQSMETVTQGSSGNEGLHALSFTTVNCAYGGGCTQ